MHFLLGRLIGALPPAAAPAVRWPAATALLPWLGQRTLPIYLLHFSIILRLVWVLLVAGVTIPPAVGVVLPPLATASAIALSLAIHATRRMPGLWDVPWRRG